MFKVKKTKENIYDAGYTNITNYEFVLDKSYTVEEFLLEWFNKGYDIVGMKNGEISTNGYALISKTRSVIFPTSVPYFLVKQSQYNKEYDAIRWFPKETLRAKVVSVNAMQHNENGIYDVRVKCKYRLIDKIKLIRKLRIKIC